MCNQGHYKHHKSITNIRSRPVQQIELQIGSVSGKKNVKKRIRLFPAFSAEKKAGKPEKTGSGFPVFSGFLGQKKAGKAGKAGDWGPMN